MATSSILVGAEKYWEDFNKCEALDKRWEEEGLTVTKETLQIMWRKIPQERRRIVCELGCGTGRVIPLLEPFDRYIACDQSPNMLILAWDRLHNDQRIEFKKFNLYADTSPTCNLLVLSEVLQHQRDPLACLEFVRQKFEYDYLLFTLLVADEHQLFGVDEGDGSVAISSHEAFLATDGFHREIVLHEDSLSTWILLEGDLN